MDLLLAIIVVLYVGIVGVQWRALSFPLRQELAQSIRLALGLTVALTVVFLVRFWTFIRLWLFVKS